MTEHHKPKIIADWRPTAGELSPFYRKLWSLLLTNKKGTPPEQAPARDTLTDAEEGDAHE